jgi:hypothetical protein
MENIVIFLVWGSLLAIPPFAIVIFTLIRKRSFQIQSKMFRVAAIWIVLTVAAFVLKISFSIPFANFIWLIITYFSYCYASLYLCWKIHQKVIRFIVLGSAAIPVCFGYVLSTIGVLGLMFIVGDYVRPPNQIEKMKPSLVCETTLWGMAASDEGYIVHLYRFWPVVPFVRKEVVNINVDETAGQAGSSCSDALTKYSP